MTPIQEVRCHKQVPPGLAALTSTRPCVQRVRTPQSQDSDGRPCQEEWSQPGSFLGPAGPVGVALAPEWQGEHVTGPTSVPLPAQSMWRPGLPSLPGSRGELGRWPARGAVLHGEQKESGGRHSGPGRCREPSLQCGCGILSFCRRC